VVPAASLRGGRFFKGESQSRNHHSGFRRHARAGVTGGRPAGARSGMASNKVPYGATRPFRGWRLREPGVVPAFIPYRKVAAEKIAAAILPGSTDAPMRAAAAEALAGGARATTSATASGISVALNMVGRPVRLRGPFGIMDLRSFLWELRTEEEGSGAFFANGGRGRPARLAPHPRRTDRWLMTFPSGEDGSGTARTIPITCSMRGKDCCGWL
jgi:hypothetical protein